MEKFKEFSEFTAHSRNISALISMYRLIENTDVASIELTPIIVFQAFSIESFLNHLGGKHIDIWDHIERLSWRKKVEVLHTHAEKKTDWGSKELQFAAKIFKIRDRLAHGKPEFVEGSREYTSQAELEAECNRKPMLEPKWYKEITRESILSSKNDFIYLIEYFSSLMGEHKSTYLNTGSGGFITISTKEA
ncbi:hypothetical protein [Agarivorans sp. 1_MG-2023]|uniref:hypothetical protein n=1 Tax=Agarivorans sp. 1_MG-2023 TaxID=3062634 RepID=UPI0026E24884|nr:hypothetical protein [Agarivorans sp. 1_MG-2023]MDO6765813.1 hypothetical protein [Agarivorans sp. 1_MG-2023]